MEPIRAVQPTDREEWLRMRRALWPDADPVELEAEIENPTVLPGPGVVLVAPRPTGGLQGFVEVSIRSVVDGCETNNVGYVEGWFVDPDVRLQGVGRALVAAAEAWAVAQGCTEMASDTELHNTRSQAAHGRLGYQETGRVVQFKKLLPHP